MALPDTGESINPLDLDYIAVEDDGKQSYKDWLGQLLEITSGFGDDVQGRATDPAMWKHLGLTGESDRYDSSLANSPYARLLIDSIIEKRGGESGNIYTEGGGDWRWNEGDSMDSVYGGPVTVSNPNESAAYHWLLHEPQDALDFLQGEYGEDFADAPNIEGGSTTEAPAEAEAPADVPSENMQSETVNLDRPANYKDKWGRNAVSSTFETPVGQSQAFADRMSERPTAQEKIQKTLGFAEGGTVAPVRGHVPQTRGQRSFVRSYADGGIVYNAPKVEKDAGVQNVAPEGTTEAPAAPVTKSTVAKEILEQASGSGNPELDDNPTAHDYSVDEMMDDFYSDDPDRQKKGEVGLKQTATMPELVEVIANLGLTRATLGAVKGQATFDKTRASKALRDKELGYGNTSIGGRGAGTGGQGSGQGAPGESVDGAPSRGGPDPSGMGGGPQDAGQAVGGTSTGTDTTDGTAADAAPFAEGGVIPDAPERSMATRMPPSHEDAPTTEQLPKGFIPPMPGAGGPKDDQVPINASPGETVLNAEATMMFGPVLEQMNSHARSFMQKMHAQMNA